MEFKELVKETRLKKKISAYKMAKDLNISRTTILKYESGEIEPTLSKADMICKYLNIRYLLGE